MLKDFLQLQLGHWEGYENSSKACKIVDMVTFLEEALVLRVR